MSQRVWLIISTLIYLHGVQCGIIPLLNSSDDDIKSQGLYDKFDKINVLTSNNFMEKVYVEDQSWLVQFYNSWCGFCRKFSPEWKKFGADVSNWENVVRIGAIDCAVDSNNNICREYEIMAYPSIRFFRRNLARGDIGIPVQKGDNAENQKFILLNFLQTEQNSGNGQGWPDLSIHEIDDVTSAWEKSPQDVKYTFLVFEYDNSTIGNEVALDLLAIKDILIKRVTMSSNLAQTLGVSVSPTIAYSQRTHSNKFIVMKNLVPERKSFVKAILSHLESNHIYIPVGIAINDNYALLPSGNADSKNKYINDSKFDMIYQQDLETALRYSLHHEATQYKLIDGERLNALRNYLETLIKYFPFTANGKLFVQQLKGSIDSRESWSGAELDKLINVMEKEVAPVYSTPSEWLGCMGSSPHYRGYTCGLWQSFHALTVGALRYGSREGHRVLSAIHGYVKYFMGCADCSQHFQEMAARNKLEETTNSDTAVIWLWMAHNEVNARLAGDATEDPAYPKRAFPSAIACPLCRKDKLWDIPQVLEYLQVLYGSGIQRSLTAPTLQAPLTRLDVGLLGILYIFSFLILIVVIKVFLSRRFYRKKMYRHDTRGKV